MLFRTNIKLKRGAALLVFLAIGGFYSVVARADLVASLNATEITTEQTLQLTITSTLSQGEPNLTVLAADFEILGRSSQSNIETVGQRMTHTRSWIIELLPKRSGVYTIPAFDVGGEKSQPLQLTVTAAPVAQAGEDKGGYFLEASIDNASPYVQAQVIYTLRVFAVQNFVDGSLSEPEAEGMLVQKLGDGRDYIERRYGRRYSVIERQYALFPQRSGEFTLPPAVLNARVPADGSRTRGFFTPTKPVRRRGESFTLTVQPRPADTGASWWLPAKSVELSARWDGNASVLRSGESVTRTVTLLAEGVGSTQLPSIALPQATDFKIYANQPELGDGSAAGGVKSQRIEKWAVVARKPGELTLPEIRVPWFNITTGQQEVAVLPAETLQVLPAVGTNLTEQLAPQSHTPATAPTADSPLDPATEASAETNRSLALPTAAGVSALSQASPWWKRVALLMSLVWVLTLGGFFWYWRRTSSLHSGAARNSGTTHDEASMRVVRSACNSGDLQQAFPALLNWARGHWPQDPPRNLAAIARRLGSDSLADTFRVLDSARYAKSGTEEALREARVAAALENLPEQLKSAVKSGSAAVKSRQTSALPAL